MDALAGLLDGPRARGAFLLQNVFEPPFAVRIQDESPLALVSMVRGAAWITADGAAPVQLHPGDLAVLRGPNPCTFADDLATPIGAVVHPGQVCMTPGGELLADQMRLGVRAWGNRVDGSIVLLSGVYQMRGEVSQRLLRALPPILVLRAEEWRSPLVDLLTEEVAKDEPGQDVVLDRLLDLLLIAVLRVWFSRAEAATPDWYRAQSDPIVGPALHLLHHEPSRAWTVAELAAEVGVSRAALARRFTALVGEAPMSFLTGWRLALAADLLREPDTTLEAVARRVGYSSAFALSAAFKRVRGMSPQQHRAAVG